jgi:hypothetical protein
MLLLTSLIRSDDKLERPTVIAYGHEFGNKHKQEKWQS